jgi:hypothetical protein
VHTNQSVTEKSTSKTHQNVAGMWQTHHTMLNVMYVCINHTFPSDTRARFSAKLMKEKQQYQQRQQHRKNKKKTLCYNQLRHGKQTHRKSTVEMKIHYSPTEKYIDTYIIYIYGKKGL